MIGWIKMIGQWKRTVSGTIKSVVAGGSQNPVVPSDIFEFNIEFVPPAVLSSIFSLIPFIIPLSSYNLLIFSPPLFFFPYFHRPFFYFFLFAHRLNLITFTKACNWFFRRLKIRKIILRPSPPPSVCFRFRSPPFFTLPLIRIYIFIVLFLLR